MAISYVDQLTNNTTDYYTVIDQVDGDRIITSPIWYTRRVVTATTLSEEPLAVEVFPNPTHSTATVSYFLPTAIPVQAEMFDAVGKRVMTLADGQVQGVGPHTLMVPTLATGLYVVRLAYKGGVTFRKLVIE